MASERRDKIRMLSNRTKPERPSARRRNCRQWIVRWIGAGRRKMASGGDERDMQVPTSSVEYLRWDDTFGKAVTIQTGGISGHLAEVMQLIPKKP